MKSVRILITALASLITVHKFTYLRFSTKDFLLSVHNRFKSLCGK
jgi:hypothetical protein